MPALFIEVRMENVNNTGKGRLVVTVLAILASFLVVAFLVRQMVKVTQPRAVAADRAGARAKDNAEIRAAGANALQNWGYVDQGKGVVRMPIEEAMKVTVQGYQSGGAFHSNLVARVEKATAAPPKPPEKKSEYE
jgi:hypothetical protein